MNYCYILYSETINRYYIGETEDLSARVLQHNEGLYKGSFTKQASDWKLCVSIKCNDRGMARKVERYIKSRKSRKYIERLIGDQKVRDKLFSKYS